IEVIGWTGELGDTPTPEQVNDGLLTATKNHRVDRVIVAVKDRRGFTPMKSLLDLRIGGIKVEEATSLLEKIQGKIEVDELYPSFLIFGEGFRLNAWVLFVRRLVSISLSLGVLLVFLPLIPLIALAIKFTSPGPVIY